MMYLGRAEDRVVLFDVMNHKVLRLSSNDAVITTNITKGSETLSADCTSNAR
jgi:hypothetical protein